MILEKDVPILDLILENLIKTEGKTTVRFYSDSGLIPNNSENWKIKAEWERILSIIKFYNCAKINPELNEDNWANLERNLETSRFFKNGGFKEKLKYEQSIKKGNIEKPKETEMKIDIFISHSGHDSDTAKLLIDLLKTSLNLSSAKIRCTSVNGYRLPAGAPTDDMLKKEVHESKVLIGLISANSINSAYVLFELGARWGASLPLIPLITSKLGNELLKGPLSGINALNCCESAQLQQLISDLKTELKVIGEAPEVYQDKINLLVNHCLKESLSTIKVTATSNKPTKQKSNNSVQKNDDKIKSYCEKQWPGDYSMRVHCIKEQKEAKQDIEKSRPNDIPENIFNGILNKAILEWATDYTMQVHSRNEQIEAYRELNDL